MVRLVSAQANAFPEIAITDIAAILDTADGTQEQPETALQTQALPLTRPSMGYAEAEVGKRFAAASGAITFHATAEYAQIIPASIRPTRQILL